MKSVRQQKNENNQETCLYTVPPSVHLQQKPAQIFGTKKGKTEIEKITWALTCLCMDLVLV